MRVNRCDKRIQSVREGGTFDDRGLSSGSDLHQMEQKLEFEESSVNPCEQDLDGKKVKTAVVHKI